MVAPLLRRRGLSCVFFVITDLIDNQVIFRESAASLCIQAILQMPFERVESIIAELGSARGCEPKRGASLPAPTTHVRSKSPILARIWILVSCRSLHWLLQLPASEEGQLAACLRASASTLRATCSTRSPISRVSRYGSYMRTALRSARTVAAIVASRIFRGPTRSMRSSSPAASFARSRVSRAFRSRFPISVAGWTGPGSPGFAEQHDFIGLFFDTDGVREDEPFVVQRVFGERFSRDRNLDAILRRAWARPSAWRRRSPGSVGPRRASPFMTAPLLITPVTRLHLRRTLCRSSAKEISRDAAEVCDRLSRLVADVAGDGRNHRRMAGARFGSSLRALARYSRNAVRSIRKSCLAQ